MLEMPSIESDFPVFGGVDFNLLYCYEIPVDHLLVKSGQAVYNSARFRHEPAGTTGTGESGICRKALPLQGNSFAERR